MNVPDELSPPPLSVAVVIPAYKAVATIGETLRAVLAQTHRPAAVVVVDDGSPDETAAVARGFDGVQVVTQANAGPAAARNAGVRRVDAAFVAFTDSDCRPTPTWLADLLAGFDAADVAGVGGPVRGIGDDLISRYVDATHMLDPGVLDDGHVEFLVTANACFRRDAFVAVGGFDERFRRPGGEEPELCDRLYRAGYTLRALAADGAAGVVYHHHKQTARVLMRTMANYGRGHWLLATMVPRHAFKRGPTDLFVRHLFNARRLVAGVRRKRHALGWREAAGRAGLQYLSDVAFYWGYRRAARADTGNRS